MSHMIGRPDDGLLDVMLGQDADPERAFIDGSGPAQEAGDDGEERVQGDEPTVPEP